MIALQEKEELRKEELRETAPRVTARGHLELRDWERPQRPVETQGPRKAVIAAAPVRRSQIDRWIERGLALLVVTTIAAVCACMAHL